MQYYFYHKVILRDLSDNTESTVPVFILEILKELTVIKINNLAIVLVSNKKKSWRLTNFMKAGMLLRILRTYEAVTQN
jgi:hypothetical protein